MFRRWIAFLVSLILVVLGVSSAADPDPDVIRAVICAKARDTIGARQRYSFEGPEATRSATSERLYEQRVNSVVLLINTAIEGILSGGGGLISSEGVVVTNWHVVEGARYIGVWLKQRPPSKSDTTCRNMIIGEVGPVDPIRDLAIVRLQQERSGTRPWSGINPLPLADFSKIRPGQDVFAIGHPKGWVWSYTRGGVSQVRQKFSWEDEEGNQYQATLIQTQTPISPGSSGAPLFDMEGRVIGIITLSVPEAQNLNFAIAVNEIQDFISKPSEVQQLERRMPESPSAPSSVTPPQSSSGARKEDRSGKAVYVASTDPTLAHYFVVIEEKITGNWTPPKIVAPGTAPTVLLSLRILRSGQIRDLGIESSSGDRLLDDSTLRAIRLSTPLPPLPPLFKAETLNLQLRFTYVAEEN